MESYPTPCGPPMATFYHATPKRNLSRILDQGLVPVAHAQSEGRWVFLFRSLDPAVDMAAFLSSRREPWIVLKVDVPWPWGIPDDGYNPEERLHHDAYKVPRTVPPKRIKGMVARAPA